MQLYETDIMKASAGNLCQNSQKHPWWKESKLLSNLLILTNRPSLVALRRITVSSSLLIPHIVLHTTYIKSKSQREASPPAMGNYLLNLKKYQLNLRSNGRSYKFGLSSSQVWLTTTFHASAFLWGNQLQQLWKRQVEKQDCGTHVIIGDGQETSTTLKADV